MRRYAEGEQVERDVERMPWSPAQVVALVAGAGLVVLGVIALLRTGLDTDQLTGEEVAVAGLHHTALLGLIEIGFGLLLVMAGAIPGAAREVMVFLGVVLLGFGIVVLVEPGSFHDSLATHTEHGWVYLVGGIVTILAAMLSPVIWGRDRRAVARRDREVLVR
jgi:hypothetical protein